MSEKQDGTESLGALRGSHDGDCDCGMKQPDNLRKCENPGCENYGCDSCDCIVWYESPGDPMNGIYLCESCQ